MTTEPVSLTDALATFDQLWSPRIVASVNDYDVRIARVRGEHVWHTHENTDEFFLVLDGALTVELRDRSVTLPTGSGFVVPRGIEHKPVSESGASIMMFEPTGTSTVGDRHDEVPDHVDATTGHQL